MSEPKFLSQITLNVSSSASTVHLLAERFPDIVANQWKTGEQTPFGNKTHAYDFVQLLIGDGDYSSALRKTEAWLSQHHNEISPLSKNHEAAGITISIPFQINNKTGGKVHSSGRTIRVPFSLVKLCHDHQLEISFDVQYNRDET